MLAASLVFIVGLLGLTSQAAPAPARTASNITYVKGPVTKAKAATACPSGSTPLDVTIGNIQQASAVLTAGDVSAKGAWIDSYNGDDYAPSCVALYANTVTVPEGGCDASLPVLCAAETPAA